MIELKEINEEVSSKEELFIGSVSHGKEHKKWTNATKLLLGIGKLRKILIYRRKATQKLLAT